MVSDNFEVRDRRDIPIFIDSALDDYGLTPAEARVYMRLARRSGGGLGAFEGVPKMAKALGMSERTIQRTLQVLVRCGLVSDQPRRGYTTIYTLNPKEEWRPSYRLGQIRQEVYGRRGDTRVTGDIREPGVVTQETGEVVTPETDEGTPDEVTPPNTHTGLGYVARGPSGRACVCAGVKIHPWGADPLHEQ